MEILHTKIGKIEDYTRVNYVGVRRGGFGMGRGYVHQ